MVSEERKIFWNNIFDHMDTLEEGSQEYNKYVELLRLFDLLEHCTSQFECSIDCSKRQITIQL